MGELRDIDALILDQLLHLPLPGAQLRFAAVQVRSALDAKDMLAPLLEDRGWRLVPPGHTLLPADRHEAEVMSVISDASLRRSP
jgi:hypothetical protein